GGGFALGSVDLYHDDAASTAAEVGAVVVSVEYRLAPEHPFPAGLEDCYAALSWTAAHAGDLGIDPDRLAVGGESAGGGLSAAVALL
ncbi:alpha/beta hydrolase, partial [Micromonospora aurantiaca]|nr:alpha/beta hydrolase [Micromonospora aurantiaca]